MASFDYLLNPLYPIKECSSCGSLYIMDYCCSGGSLGDKIICHLNQTPDLSQQPPQNYPKCGNPVDGQYCQGCALLRKQFKEDLFTYYPFVVNQDPDKNSTQSPPQINHHCCYGCGDLLEDIFCHECTCELCGKGAHYGYNCPPKVPIVPNPKPFNNHTVDEFPQIVPSFDPTCYSKEENLFTCDSKSNLVHDSPNVFDPPSQHPLYSCEFYGNDACYGHYCTHQEPDNSLSMRDEHLDTIPATKLDKFIKSSVENLVPNPSESEGEYECDVPTCEVFTTFSNILFDVDYDFYSSDDQSFYDEDISKEIYSNPLFDEEIISMKIDSHHFNAESDHIESLPNHDSLIISSSLKIDSLFDEFTVEPTLLKSILPGIDETDCDPEEEIRLIKRLLYDNSSPRPPEEFIFKNSDTAFESFSLFPILVEDNDYDSERDILILEELLSNDSLLLPKNESFHFDIPSSSRPPTKPPDGNSRILNVKMMGDIFEHTVPMPRLMFTQSTLVLNQEKSPKLLPYLGHKAFQPSSKCPMMIY
uniref:Uncharacterized protein n=1 Tax=Tanacetum cinerariifolium TaxID=118510 RepID=A0A6L2LIL0_TANCI|nr:hypothetical protein [Tanacetum cinerariifolium]